MARTRKLTVEIAGDVRGVKNAFGQAERSAGSLGGKLASLGKVAAVGIGGLAVGGAALAKGFVDAAVESQKVTAQTSAVIKSMGGAANVSAKQVADLSAALSLKTGVDDELIQSGSNVMLTFGKVRNEVGKGNKIFDRATASALDMSVALGTDMKSASMLVGKALNDPIRGLTALRRSGIQFTKQQEDQIKTMVEVGDTMGAQKIILGELDKQFGGSAEAQATAQDKLKVAWGNLQEQLGEKLLPVVERMATWLADNLPAAMAVLSDAFTRAKPYISDMADAVKLFISDALVALKSWWDTNGPLVMSTINALKEGIQMAFGAVIEAGKFVIEHWDQFKIVAAGIAGLIVGHYVRMAASATASAAVQTAAWVKVEVQAIASAAKIAVAATKALGPLGLVIAAAMEINNLVGQKTPNKSPLQGGSWNPFDGMDFQLPSANPLNWVGIGGNAQGTNNWRGGLSWVGEGGKELVNLPRGSQVFSHSQSMAMAGGGGAQVIQLVVDRRVLAEVIANENTVQARNRAS